MLGNVVPPPIAEPRLNELIAGFAILVAGVAALTRRRPEGPIAGDSGSVRRAVGFALVYVLCASAFGRVLAPALMGAERSPWLLALGAVLCVTLGLLAWVVSLAEGRPFAEYGFRGGPAMRMAVAFALGLAVVPLFAGRHWAALLSGQATVGGDALVFAVAFAAIGSALPDEMLFRGYLQGALGARAGRWVGLAVPALAFATLRGLRYLPNQDLTMEDWLRHVLGVAIPLGLWWGFVRDLARGSLWPTYVSNLMLEFGRVAAGAPPVALHSGG